MELRKRSCVNYSEDKLFSGNLKRKSNENEKTEAKKQGDKIKKARTSNKNAKTEKNVAEDKVKKTVKQVAKKKLTKKELDEKNEEKKDDEVELTQDKAKVDEVNENKDNKEEIDEKEKIEKIEIEKELEDKKEIEEKEKVETKPEVTEVAKEEIKESESKKIEESKTEEKKSDDDWKIEDYLTDNDWKELLSEEFKKDYFVEINKKLKADYKKGIVRPPKELVFNALNSTKLDQIKVVILGQDPYHDDDQAHGLSFSVPEGVAIPPSLKNIFLELKNDLPDFERDESLGGCLQKWTQQGVFLLNTFLTVEAHKAGSHSKLGWGTFTDKVIQLISEKNTGCVFLLWGNFSHKKESLIDSKKHKVIKTGHPSPLSIKFFSGCKCFSKSNDYLKSINKTPVNWSLSKN